MQITYTTTRWDDRRQVYLDEVVAILRVDSRGDVSIDGDPTYVDTDVSVMDLDRRRPVTFHEDREAWARNLWTAYRTPDLSVEVSEGDADAVELLRVPDVAIAGQAVHRA